MKFNLKTNHPNSIFLVIVESPSKCSKIEHFLGSNYSCIASIGHLRQIRGLKSIDTKSSFEPTYDIIEDKKLHIDKMKKLIGKYDKRNIFLATDDDREGEAIAWHICQLFELPLTTKRILFHEITKKAIVDAIDSPTTINMALVDAQKARQVLDVIVGYKISPFLWRYLYNNKDNSLSAGRCQTPALRLVYENEFQNKDLVQSYKIFGNFTIKQLLFQCDKQFEQEEEIISFLDQCKEYEFALKVHDQTMITKGPPTPFCTSKLLQTANSVLQMSPKETMSHCQQLYQTGYITYMRTESKQFSKDFLDKMNKYICDKHGSEYVGNLEKLKNTNSENPHEAIRVTQIEISTIANCKSNRMNSLYKLIWRQTMESCMSNALYNNNKITIAAPLDSTFVHNVESPKFLGWKIIEKKVNVSDLQNESQAIIQYLATLEKSGKVNYNNIYSEVSCKSSHSYYTEASLINKLESLEIGRPSTFATIVETIKDRGYVKKMNIEGKKVRCNAYTLKGKKITKKTDEKVFGAEKNKLVIQTIGILALEFLTNYFDKIFSYEYTKDMEKQLDLISNKEVEKWSDVCSNCYTELKELSQEIKNVKKNAYNICDGYELLFEKYGPVIRHTLEDGNIEYLPGNKQIQIDLEKLKKQKYELHELVDAADQSLGMYEDQELFLKNGKYGYYVEWGEKRESIKQIKKPVNEITYDDIITFLKDKKNDPTMLRVFNDNLSVRKGKYGPYIFYKTADMKKPSFFNIKKCPFGFLSCTEEEMISWINDTYKQNI